jgi:hypothetical protein
VLPLADAEIEVHKGQRDVVVRLADSRDSLTAFVHGHKLAQQGLDMMSVLGKLDAVIQDAEDDHLVWWTEPAGVVLRLVSTTTLKLGVGSVTMTVHDKDGNLVPPTPITPRHHIAFRYYRLAQTSEDLYDAYRNMYLAFEVLLSSQSPIRKGENEIAWLQRALGAAAAKIQLDDLKPSGGGVAAESILEAIYRDARLPLFHAKEGRDYFAPQDSASDREVVSKALGILTHLVLRMADAWFSARRIGGAVALGWVYEAARSQLAGCSVFATDYDGPFDPDEPDLTHPRFAAAVKLTSRLAPEFERGREPALFSAVNGAALAPLGPLRRVEVVTSKHPQIASIFETELRCDALARFEVLMHIRGMNLNQPKSLFRK